MLELGITRRRLAWVRAGCRPHRVLRLQRHVEVRKEVLVLGRVRQRLSCLLVHLREVRLPHGHHFGHPGGRVGTRHERRLGDAPSVAQQRDALVHLVEEKEANEGDVVLALVDGDSCELLELRRGRGGRTQQQLTGQVPGFGQARCGEVDVADAHGQLAQLLPLGLARLHPVDNLARDGKLAELHRKLKLIIGIRGDAQCVCGEPAGFEESRHAVVLVRRDGRQELLRSLELPAKHQRLILDEVEE
mmetsp:Transcript_34256/g.86149  ORF Transcript_34256/g.86149 Transcript_34256/m.86149 type:complete len:246 (+) Transcript_34256:706-1443(+)